MSEEVIQPIIRKKKVINADGHHGGAWKVAYADFVTAMMAFFLLMWLLNATTEDQRKGIADYFNPTIPLSRISGGGPDALSGSSIYTEDTLARDGTGANDKKTEYAQEKEDAETEAAPQKVLEATEAATAGTMGTESGSLEDATQKMELLERMIAESDGAISEHMRIKMTPEGIAIELVEADGVPLFALGNALPSELLKTLVEIVAVSFEGVENKVKIVGHTDSRAFPSERGYSNWDLSTDRANTARRLLMEAGFPSAQIAEVSGKADTEPLSPDGYAPENRRISVTILR